ncbi:hypothetical protein [Enhydrobacter sp.]|uniref:hypothetical protein n=1 Tax=Enhydrobacter sp. TaxID=1894999 RepID=UPI00260B4BEB|nr:hypothetical protein [Enhydrobacter sp.]
MISVEASGGETVRYVLTTGGAAPRYAVILMPGGRGELPLRQADGPLASALTDDFLIRSRTLFADSRFVAASTAATATPARVLAIEHDLERRFGTISVYVIGTSRSTEATQALAAPLDGQVAGFVHTSSMKEIAGFDPRKFRSRHLLVANRRDACRVTPPSSAIAAHETYGVDLVMVDGGRSVGEDCSSSAYHGYNGIERETVDKIKEWIAAGR